jgi:glycosyltransferase involved in cell wall biosynthesis
MRDAIAIWTNMPNHYQRAFITALRSRCADVVACYYSRPDEERLRMKWDECRALPDGEMYVPETAGAVELVSDWRRRLHIITGYSRPFLRALVRRLAHEGVRWVHWSEASKPGWQWYARVPLKRWYAGMVNRSALGAFGIGTAAVRDLVRWGIRHEKVALLPYSNPPADLDLEPDAQCGDFLDGRRAFIFLGSLCPRKGIDVLLRAFSKLGPTSKGWAIVFVGSDCENGRYQTSAKSLGLDKQVLFRGPVAPSHIGSVLRIASVFVLPTRYDGWGVALAEAASAGLPLISTDQCASAYHLIEPGCNGFRVKAGDVESLHLALRSYVANPGLIPDHGYHSRRLFQGYTPERNADRFIRATETWSAGRHSAETCAQGLREAALGARN